MNNHNLFFEATDISTPEEVRTAYLVAQEKNVKYYRAVSKSNRIVYGWDSEKNQYIMLDYALKNCPEVVEKIDGTYWFVNERFKAAQLVNVDAKTASEEETPYVVDYKVLYERIYPKYETAKETASQVEQCRKDLSETREALSKKTVEYNALDAKMKDTQGKTLAKVDELDKKITSLTEALAGIKASLEEIKAFGME